MSIYRSENLVVVLVLGFSLIAGAAFADVVIPVSASTTMGSGFGTLLDNTINGEGLDSFPSLDAFHDPTVPANSWVADGLITGFVDFQFDDTYFIDGFSFWNQNAGGPGLDGSTGIQDVIVLASTDGVTFSQIIGAPMIFSQVTTDGSAPEQFSFNAVAATHIRFEIGSNWGDIGQTGFAEVAFSGTVVPEPSLTALAGMLLVTAALRRRRHGK